MVEVGGGYSLIRARGDSPDPIRRDHPLDRLPENRFDAWVQVSPRADFSALVRAIYFGDNVGNDMDLYRDWAMAVCAGRTTQTASRRYAAGIIALRPDRDGHIAGYEGLEAIGNAFGQHLIDVHLPPKGTPTQPVAAGYMANAWLRMKHDNYDELRRILDIVGQTVKVHAH